MNHALILGMDFISEQKVTIDGSNNTVQIQKGITVTQMIPNDPNYIKCQMVRLFSDIMVPPRHGMVVKLTTKAPQNTQLALLEPHPSLPTKYSIMGVACVVSHKTKIVP